MKRLTERNESGQAFYKHCFEEPCNGLGEEKCISCVYTNEMVCEKLAAYEDTNLAPEQFTELDKLYLAKCEEVNQLNAELEKAEPYIRLAEKMCLCDLIAENQRKENKGGGISMRTIEEVVKEIKNIHELEAELKGKITPSKIPILLNEILEIGKSIESVKGDLIR